LVVGDGESSITNVSVSPSVVDIGTALSGSSTLEIVGNATIGGNIRTSGSVGIGTASPITALDVHHDPTSLSNDTGGGEVVLFGGGTTGAGRLYYLHTDGNWAATDADGVADGADQLLAIALGTTPGTHGMLIRGFADIAADLSNFSPGKAVYISDNPAGSMDTVAPAGSGDFVRVVGWCTTTANVIYFNPSGDWVELA